MKFSDTTIDILKNFVSINSGIHFKKGNLLISVHPERVIMGQAKLEDSIPQDFVIGDLSSLLSVIEILKEPDVEVKKEKLVLKNGDRGVNFKYAGEGTVKEPPKEEITLATDFEFVLPKQDLDDIRRACKAMRLEFFKIEGNGELISLVAYDPKDPSNSSFKFNTKVATDKTFTCIIKESNLLIVDGSYNIGVALTGKWKAAILSSVEKPIKYFVALEAGSKI